MEVVDWHVMNRVSIRRRPRFGLARHLGHSVYSQGLPRAMNRIEVITLAEPRRRWSRLEKERCYIPRINQPGRTRLCAVLNSAHWPTDAALARGDVRAIRWLFSLAVLERLSFEPVGPITQIRRRLVAVGARGWPASMGKSAVVRLPAQRSRAKRTGRDIANLWIDPGPHKISGFEVQ
jgi:hypothetical protein